MEALRKTYPSINSIKRELTMLICIITLFITIANFIVIFGNSYVLHTENKDIWTYDLFAMLFWIVNICVWLMTYWDIIEDNQFIHLLFFVTPLILMIWGTILISQITQIMVRSLWNLFLASYISSIVVTTIFGFFIVHEIKKIQNEEIEETHVSINNNHIIKGTYKLMTNSDENYSV